MQSRTCDRGSTDSQPITAELIARVLLLLNYFGNDRDTLYTDYILWKRSIEHNIFHPYSNDKTSWKL